MDQTYLKHQKDVDEARRSLDNIKFALNLLEENGHGRSDDANAYRGAIEALEKALEKLENQKVNTGFDVPISFHAPDEVLKAKTATVGQSVYIIIEGLGDATEMLKKSREEYRQQQNQK
ncbi:MAG TPA: hypothetical protein VMQ44_00960 [Candidatus Saccharimonadales bacterium]|nr:hypothetical protein [Candidatus Saccharimonadales bacterium]